MFLPYSPKCLEGEFSEVHSVGAAQIAVLIASGVAAMFGVIEAGGAVQGLATIPEALWELLLGIWPIVRGFNPSAIARLEHESL